MEYPFEQAGLSHAPSDRRPSLFTSWMNICRRSHPGFRTQMSTCDAAPQSLMGFGGLSKCWPDTTIEHSVYWFAHSQQIDKHPERCTAGYVGIGTPHSVLLVLQYQPSSHGCSAGCVAETKRWVRPSSPCMSRSSWL